MIESSEVAHSSDERERPTPQNSDATAADLSPPRRRRRSSKPPAAGSPTNEPALRPKNLGDISMRAGSKTKAQADGAAAAASIAVENARSPLSEPRRRRRRSNSPEPTDKPVVVPRVHVTVSAASGPPSPHESDSAESSASSAAAGPSSGERGSSPAPQEVAVTAGSAQASSELVRNSVASQEQRLSQTSASRRRRRSRSDEPAAANDAGQRPSRSADESSAERSRVSAPFLPEPSEARTNGEPSCPAADAGRAADAQAATAAAARLAAATAVGPPDSEPSSPDCDYASLDRTAREGVADDYATLSTRDSSAASSALALSAAAISATPTSVAAVSEGAASRLQVSGSSRQAEAGSRRRRRRSSEQPDGGEESDSGTVAASGVIIHSGSQATRPFLSKADAAQSEAELGGGVKAAAAGQSERRSRRSLERADTEHKDRSVPAMSSAGKLSESQPTGVSAANSAMASNARLGTSARMVTGELRDHSRWPPESDGKDRGVSAMSSIGHANNVPTARSAGASAAELAGRAQTAAVESRRRRRRSNEPDDSKGEGQGVSRRSDARAQGENRPDDASTELVDPETSSRQRSRGRLQSRELAIKKRAQEEDAVALPAPPRDDIAPRAGGNAEHHAAKIAQPVGAPAAPNADSEKGNDDEGYDTLSPNGSETDERKTFESPKTYTARREETKDRSHPEAVSSGKTPDQPSRTVERSSATILRRGREPMESAAENPGVATALVRAVGSGSATSMAASALPKPVFLDSHVAAARASVRPDRSRLPEIAQPGTEASLLLARRDGGALESDSRPEEDEREFVINVLSPRSRLLSFAGQDPVIQSALADSGSENEESGGTTPRQQRGRSRSTSSEAPSDDAGKGRRSASSEAPSDDADRRNSPLSPGDSRDVTESSSDGQNDDAAKELDSRSATQPNPSSALGYESPRIADRGCLNRTAGTAEGSDARNDDTCDSTSRDDEPAATAPASALAGEPTPCAPPPAHPLSPPKKEPLGRVQSAGAPGRSETELASAISLPSPGSRFREAEEKASWSAETPAIRRSSPAAVPVKDAVLPQRAESTRADEVALSAAETSELRWGPAAGTCSERVRDGPSVIIGGGAARGSVLNERDCVIGAGARVSADVDDGKCSSQAGVPVRRSLLAKAGGLNGSTAVASSANHVDALKDGVTTDGSQMRDVRYTAEFNLSNRTTSHESASTNAPKFLLKPSDRARAVERAAQILSSDVASASCPTTSGAHYWRPPLRFSGESKSAVPVTARAAASERAAAASASVDLTLADGDLSQVAKAALGKNEQAIGRTHPAAAVRTSPKPADWSTLGAPNEISEGQRSSAENLFACSPADEREQAPSSLSSVVSTAGSDALLRRGPARKDSLVMQMRKKYEGAAAEALRNAPLNRRGPTAEYSRFGRAGSAQHARAGSAQHAHAAQGRGFAAAARRPPVAAAATAARGAAQPHRDQEAEADRWSPDLAPANIPILAGLSTNLNQSANSRTRAGAVHERDGEQYDPELVFSSSNPSFFVVLFVLCELNNQSRLKTTSVQRAGIRGVEGNAERGRYDFGASAKTAVYAFAKTAGAVFRMVMLRACNVPQRNWPSASSVQSSRNRAKMAYEQLLGEPFVLCSDICTARKYWSEFDRLYPHFFIEKELMEAEQTGRDVTALNAVMVIFRRDFREVIEVTVVTDTGYSGEMSFDSNVSVTCVRREIADGEPKFWLKLLRDVVQAGSLSLAEHFNSVRCGPNRARMPRYGDVESDVSRLFTSLMSNPRKQAQACDASAGFKKIQ